MSQKHAVSNAAEGESNTKHTASNPKHGERYAAHTAGNAAEAGTTQQKPPLNLHRLPLFINTLP